MLYSEEDIRSQVVMFWLADHGFTPSEISVEHSFEVQFGHSKKTFRPRSDILIKSTDGRNLIMLEVKAPDVDLDDKARDQALSYARLLTKGGIAPFTITTNGKQTKIYDSITGDLINEESIPKSHPYASADFKATCNDIELKSEALERLISLSPENLLGFCKTQVTDRMSILRSRDFNDGKKYIPSLYVDRKAATDELERYLKSDTQSVFLIQGAPQIGKTSFICNAADKLLERGEPCLFYAAVSLHDSLLIEICNDFLWILGDPGNAYQLINHRLERILKSTTKKLTIFIDGLNEAGLEVVKNIDLTTEKLARHHIKFVITMTNTSARRLLFDNKGNPSRIADAVPLSANEIIKMELSPDKFNKPGIIYLPRYNNEEISIAYEKYSSAYNVSLHASHDRNIDDPFLLRILMEQLSGSTLTHSSVSEPELIQKSIERKSQRAYGPSRVSGVKRLLTKLAGLAYTKDFPVLEDLVLDQWIIPLDQGTPEQLLDAALLIRSGNGDDSFSLDFYYGRERNYVISYWSQEWPSLFKNHDLGQKSLELKSALSTQAGKEAIHWFLCLPKNRNVLRNLLENLTISENGDTYSELLRCLGQVIDKNNALENEIWVQSTVKAAVYSKNSDVKIEAAKILAMASDEIAEYLDKEDHSLDGSLVVSLLAIENDYPLSAESASENVLYALSEYHSSFLCLGNGYDDFETPDGELAVLLQELLYHSDNTLSTAAAKAYGYIAPFNYMKWISVSCLNSENVILKELPVRASQASGIEFAISQINEIYYGSLCPGVLNWIHEEPENQKAEYERMHELFMPIIRSSPDNCSNAQKLQSLLKNLKPEGILVATDIEPVEDKFQFKLPFTKEDCKYNAALLNSPEVNQNFSA